VIKRRRVFYTEGYDPQGAAGYYRLFQYAAKRALQIWPITLDLGKLELDSDLLAHWRIETAGASWSISTHYEFLRLEGVITGNMSQPLWRQIPRALRWALDDLWSGTTRRIYKASRRFAVHLIYFQLMLLAWLAIPLGVGVLAGISARRLAALPPAASLLAAIAIMIGLFVLLRALAGRWFVLQINSCWPHIREFARGVPSAFNQAIDLFASRIVAAARAGDADEIVVIGHSGGGVFAPSVMARALELAPDLGRCGPRVVLLTLGSIMPAAALHPGADRLRAQVQRIVLEPSILWIDCQSRTDWLNFLDFDPVAGLGLRADPDRRSPLQWAVRFRDMLTPESFARLRWNVFRRHYQFIMGNDKRAPFDYVMLTCSPVPVETWPKHGWDVVASFGDGGSHPETSGSAGPAETSSPMAVRKLQAST
jgi:hypothetical protein